MRGAKVGYAALVVATLAAHLALVVIGTLPPWSLLALAALFFHARAALTIWRHAGERVCIKASRDTIVGHALYGAVLAVVLALS
jgi:1,4-dihydroxy-2-naphthoate octaprenyltransferase